MGLVFSTCHSEVWYCFSLCAKAVLNVHSTFDDRNIKLQKYFKKEVELLGTTVRFLSDFFFGSWETNTCQLHQKILFPYKAFRLRGSYLGKTVFLYKHEQCSFFALCISKECHSDFYFFCFVLS